MLIIKKYKELDLWIEQNDYFEEGFIVKIDSNPLVITVGTLIEGNYKANSKKILHAYEINPINVLEWNYSLTESKEEHYVESVESLEIKEGVGLSFQTSSPIILIAESFQIIGPKLIESVFKPWLSNTEISFEANLDHVPKPSFWIERFKNFGYDVVFRYFDSDEKKIEEIPYPDYAGYFFQFSKHLKTTKTGIFIRFISFKNGKVWMCFENQDKALINLWICLATILGDFPNIKISCGNCDFTNEEWKKLIKNKEYPTIMSKDC